MSLWTAWSCLDDEERLKSLGIDDVLLADLRPGSTHGRSALLTKTSAGGTKRRAAHC